MDSQVILRSAFIPIHRPANLQASASIFMNKKPLLPLTVPKYKSTAFYVKSGYGAKEKLEDAFIAWSYHCRDSIFKAEYAIEASDKVKKAVRDAEKVKKPASKVAQLWRTVDKLKTYEKTLKDAADAAKKEEQEASEKVMVLAGLARIHIEIEFHRGVIAKSVRN